jgi:Uncharacterised protein family (UPF0236)
MRSSTCQATTDVLEVNASARRLHLKLEVELDLPLPAQDDRLPARLERSVEQAGQALKRQIFALALEKADLLLLARRRKGPNPPRCRGKAATTFKTIFGTVRVRRQRVQHSPDGTTFVLSATAWQTPQQVCITSCLRDSACDAMAELSAADSARHLDERAGEQGLLCKSEILEIVHAQGQQLHRANQQRAEQALAADPQAATLLLPVVAAEPAQEPASSTEADEGPDLPLVREEDREQPDLPLGFAAGDYGPSSVPLDQPRQVDPGCVMVQFDEVVAHAQPTTGYKRVQAYTAVVMLAGLSWHLAAGTPGELARQAAGLLAALGVHRGEYRLMALCDGASWIREWFEALALPGKGMILCWYHLAKRVYQQLSMACRGRQHREEVQAEVLDHLWNGRADRALEVLQSRRDQMKNQEALDELSNYVKARKGYMPDYAARQQAGVWIASTRVEKFNDWAVSERCKHRGMAWTQPGLLALAVLEAARRNGELDTWRRHGELPAWELPPQTLAA